MKSAIVKRSIVLGGHKTSVSLENEFWEGLREMAEGQKTTMSMLLQKIDAERQQANLSSAIRLFVLDHYRNPPVVNHGTEAGGTRATTPWTSAAAVLV